MYVCMVCQHVTADAFRGLVSDSPGAGVAGAAWSRCCELKLGAPKSCEFLTCEPAPHSEVCGARVICFLLRALPNNDLPVDFAYRMPLSTLRSTVVTWQLSGRVVETKTLCLQIEWPRIPLWPCGLVFRVSGGKFHLLLCLVLITPNIDVLPTFTLTPSHLDLRTLPIAGAGDG